MQRIPAMLIAWGDWWIKNIERMGNPGINWLYRLIHEGGARPDVGYDTDDRGEVLVGRDKVLCPEYPKNNSNVRKIQLAVNRLPNWEQKCIIFWYCAPLKEDGHPYTKRELARILGKSKWKFDLYLRGGRRKIKNWLTTKV